jgi:hypothetical protein
MLPSGGAPPGPVTLYAFFFSSSPITRSNSTSSPSCRLRNPFVSILLCKEIEGKKADDEKCDGDDIAEQKNIFQV